METEKSCDNNSMPELDAALSSMELGKKVHAQSLQGPSIDFINSLPVANYNIDLDIEIKSNKPLSGKQYLLLIPITKFFRKYRNLYLLINILNGRSIISLRLIEYFVVNYVLENNTHYNLTKYKSRPDFIVDNLFVSGPAPIDITTENMAQKLGENDKPDEFLNSSQSKDEIRMSEIRMSILGKIRGQLTGTVDSQASGEKVLDNFDDYFLVHDNYKCQLKEYNKKNFDPFCRWTRIRMYYDKAKYFYTTVAQLNFFKWAIENYVLDYILDNLTTIEKAMNDYEKAIKKEKKIRKLNMIQSNPMVTPVCIQTEKKMETIGNVNGSLDVVGTNNLPILNTALNIDTSVDCGICNIMPNQPMTKKTNQILFSTLDKKSKLKGRKKKEFTKTNRSILKYDCTKIINFD